MKTLTYYRGSHLVTQKQKAQITKVFGLSNYVWFADMPQYDCVGSGIHDVMELFLFIENDKSLNERSIQLKERISKGLTRSRAYGIDYVETNMLFKLITDAVDEYNKEMKHHDNTSLLKDVFKYGEEFRRLYNLPMGETNIINRLAFAVDKLTALPDLTTKYEFTYKTKYTTGKDPLSTFKEYTIKGRFNIYGLDHSNKELFGDLAPFIGKVYNVQGSNYFQLYVYDFAKSNKVVRKALDILLEKNLIRLELS